MALHRLAGFFQEQHFQVLGGLQTRMHAEVRCGELVQARCSATHPPTTALVLHRSRQAKGQRKPVIMIGPRSADDKCLVIGYEATQRMRVRAVGLSGLVCGNDAGKRVE